MKTFGIIAGNGRFPVLAAREARDQGYRVVVCGIEKEADPSLESCSDVFRWIKIGQVKKLVSFFDSEGVKEAIMAGKIEKVRLFQENVSPDFDMVKILMKVRDFKDDSLLGGIADYLDENGILLKDSTMFLKSALPGAGVLGKKKPSKEVVEDIDFGFQMAKTIASLDVGQTAVVKKKAVLALEAIEGTDEAIRRGGRLGGKGTVVVKVSKPNQDMRFDVPAVGLNTLETLIEVGAQALAFEAGKTIFIDLDELTLLADKYGISLVGKETIT